MPPSQAGSPGSLPPPFFEYGNGMHIAGLHQQFASSALDEIPSLWRRLAALGSVTGRAGKVDYAVVFPLADGCDYVAGFEVTGFEDLPSVLAQVELPPQRYAIFTHSGHVSTLRNIFDAIRAWLSESGLQIAGIADGRSYLLERYGEGFDPQSGMGDIQVWVPVAEVSA